MSNEKAGLHAESSGFYHETMPHVRYISSYLMTRSHDSYASVCYLFKNPIYIKPSAYSTIFVAGDEDFCRRQRKHAVCGKQTSTIFVAGDDLQY